MSRRRGTARARADAHRKQASGATRRIPQRMIVLGIDPGLANTGYGVVARDGARLAALDGGVIETRAGVPQERRLADIHAAIDVLLAEHEPDVVALEELYFGQNVRTAFAVGHARGAVMLAAGQRGVPCASYTPQKVKSAVCGNGRAPKEQVARMVQALLALPQTPASDHASDALAVAICHVNGAPLSGSVARALQTAEAVLVR
jgi:crossover junction endodeoxyribonuclease RuvC